MLVNLVEVEQMEEVTEVEAAGEAVEAVMATVVGGLEEYLRCWLTGAWLVERMAVVCLIPRLLHHST